MHPDIYKRPLLWCLAALIAVRICFYRPAPTQRDVFHAISKQDVTLTGRVEGFAVHKPKSNNVKVKVFSVNGQPAEGYVYARFADFNPQWKDTLEINGRLQKPYGIDLLGNFDWRRYLANQHIFTEIKAKQTHVIKKAAFPWRIIRFVRADILRVFEESFPPQLASIAGGVLLGERGELSERLYTAFQDSGAIHLLVASGGNVGFVTLLTMALCGWLGVRRKQAVGAALVVAGVYALAAGADAPLVRAYFMAVCACAGYFLGRNSGVFQGLLVSCLVILCIEPASVFETGFQMSFLATVAIILCLNNYKLPAKWPGWVRFFAQIFLATLATQLVLLPIFTNVFYKVSLTGLAANMILVPWASALMGLTFGYYVLTWVHAGVLLYWPAIWCLEGFRAVVEFFASFRVSAVPVAAWSTGSVAAFYVGLFWLFNWPQKKFARRILWPCVMMILALPLGQKMFFSRGEVFLLNEWNKSAALVKMPSGKVFVLGTALEADKIEASLHKIGVRRASGVLAFDGRKGNNDLSRLAKDGQIVRPFEKGLWPGKEWAQDGVLIRMQWGKHLSRRGRLWTNAGYSGTEQDDVSYCLQEKDTSLCVGADGRFAQAGDKIIAQQRNQTVRAKI